MGLDSPGQRPETGDCDTPRPYFGGFGLGLGLGLEESLFTCALWLSTFSLFANQDEKPRVAVRACPADGSCRSCCNGTIAG